jgi:cytochrome b
MAERVETWDAPLRLFHWSLAVLVPFSYATAKAGGGWMEWHLRSGYCVLALLIFRLGWGIVGGDSARFARFVRGPRVALEYARELIARRVPQVRGHNPLGGWSVVAMLAVLLVQAGSGLFADNEISTQGPLAAKVSNAFVARMSSVHEFNQWLVLALVLLHLAAVAAYQWGVRRDVIGPMVRGGTRLPGERPGSPTVAAALFAGACGAVYYLVAVFPRAP